MVKDNLHFSDEVLIQRFRDGNQSAASALIQRYKDNVYSSIYYMVRDRFVADDLFQEAFLKVLTQIPKNNYVEQGKFLPWVLRIAHNLCIDYFRKGKKQIKVVMQDGTDLMEFFAGKTESHEQKIIRNEICDSVRDMIELLPEDQKTVIVLRVYGELSFKEIAKITEVSINTALGRMRYALKNMKKMIEEKQLALR